MAQLVAKLTEQSKQMDVVFIDFGKNSDSMPRVKLWGTMKIVEMEVSLMKIIKASDIAHIIGLEIVYQTQLIHQKHRGILSPILFNMYLRVILRKWEDVDPFE